MEVEITKERFDEAIERHEAEFEQELSEVDIKKIVLKTKKALLEQIRDNSIMKQKVADATDGVNVLLRQVEGFDNKVKNLERAVAHSDKAFSIAIKLLAEKEIEYNKEMDKGIWAKIKEYWLGWM